MIRSEPVRRRVIICLALFAALAPLNCIWRTSYEIAYYVLSAELREKGQTPPLDSGAPWHNDCGCICRGATVAEYVIAPSTPTFPIGEALEFEARPASDANGPSLALCRLDHANFPPCATTARQLCALLASRQI